MNVDTLLDGFNRHEVAYLLIGGMNFAMRHAPILTYDVDFWIEDTTENRRRCERALASLQAEWGRSEEDWQPVYDRPPGWLDRQSVFCLTSPHGPIDVFRAVEGLTSWKESRQRAQRCSTTAGTPFVSLSDEDMLRCQLALPESKQKRDRIEALRRSLEDRANHG